MSTTTVSSSTEVCDGENLAIILALYWIVYLIINAVIFSVAMYALRKFFDGIKLPSHKTKTKGDSAAVSRTGSGVSLVSRGKH